jgi:NADH-quinone oxidoreductase subunit H
MDAGVGIIKGVVLMSIMLGITGWLVLAERKVIAWLQHRVGPNRCGPFGLLQPVADVLKLLTKEECSPPFVNRVLFNLAPMIITITAMLAIAVVPFASSQVWGSVANLNLGVLFFLALSSLGVYSIVLAGWGSNSKYSMIGGLRASAQMISYELAMSMSLLGVVMMSGSLNFREIVEAQRPWWFIVLQPLGFVIFLISVIAESRRTPFDLPEAENELVAGFHTEYSSMKFALFFLGEYMGVVLLSGVVAAAYLGGYNGPLLPGPVWMLLKIAALFFFFIWIRATYPRFRYDHLMELGWKWLIPLAVLNLVITAVICLAFPDLVPNAIR